MSNKDTKKEIIRNKRKEPKDVKFYPGECFFYRNSKGGIEISTMGLIDLFIHLGFRRVSIDGFTFLVRIKDNVISPVDISKFQNPIQDEVFSFVETMPLKFSIKDEEFTRKGIKMKLMESNERYFGSSNASLIPFENVDILKDAEKESFVFYKNGYVYITADVIEFKSYKNLKGYIWEKQIIQRDFKLLEETKQFKGVICQFSEFLTHVSGRLLKYDADRLRSLQSLIGYIIHDFYAGDSRALILTDSSTDTNSQGRTGKGLIAKAIEKIRNSANISGKTWKQDNSFRWQEITRETQFVHLDDPRRGFDIETLYNDISNGFQVEKKGFTPFVQRAKLIISTNQTIKTRGSSSRGRVYEYQLDQFFSDEKTPLDHFGNYFFTGWNTEEWNKFDNFMMQCVFSYLESGVIQAPGINMQARKIIDQTHPDFAAWVLIADNGQPIKTHKRYVRAELKQDFLNYAPEWNEGKGLTTQRFTNWLDTYANENGLIMRDIPQGGVRLVVFYDSKPTNEIDINDERFNEGVQG